MNRCEECGKDIPDRVTMFCARCEARFIAEHEAGQERDRRANYSEEDCEPWFDGGRRSDADGRL
jgi:hypothetical protein